jgi:hypothetical protein
MDIMPESSPVLARTYRTWCEGCGETGETNNITRFLEHTEYTNRHLKLIMDMRREFEEGFERLVSINNIAREIRLYVNRIACDSMLP